MAYPLFLSIEELVDAVEHTNLQFTSRLIFLFFFKFVVIMSRGKQLVMSFRFSDGSRTQYFDTFLKFCVVAEHNSRVQLTMGVHCPYSLFFSTKPWL